MNNSLLNKNELSTLSVNLLSTLDQSFFFNELGRYFSNVYADCSVSVHRSFLDGSTKLISENGEELEDSKIIAKGKSVASYVSKIKRAYYSNNVSSDPLFSLEKLNKNVHSVMCFPLQSEGSVFGVVSLHSADERSFSDEDVKQCKKILKAVEAPMKNIRMYLMALEMNKDLIDKLESGEIEGSTSNEERREFNNHKVIGHNSSIQKILEITSKVANEDFPVFFQGESGVGKKMFSQIIHGKSKRSQGPCISINCATMGESNLEIELFGTKDRKGLIELANGGTLIFDEISKLSLNLQNKILRTLVSGKSFSTDGERDASVNVRIVSTSTENMEEVLEEGRFRRDLFERLNTINIKVPSLANRKQDIKYLAEYFLNNGRSEAELKVLTSGAIDALTEYHWPGNIRELKSIMERTYILFEGKYINAKDLPELSVKAVEVKEEKEEFIATTLQEVEKEHITRCLDHLNGNKTKAAKALGITVKTLYNKLHSYGLVAKKNSLSA